MVTMCWRQICWYIKFRGESEVNLPDGLVIRLVLITGDRTMSKITINRLNVV
jgi:hypothetical protein